VASKIAGLRRAEPAMLHGAVVCFWPCRSCSSSPRWAPGLFRGWYGGLAGTPVGRPAKRPRRPRCRAGGAAALRRDHGALRADRASSAWLARGSPWRPMTMTRRDDRAPVSGIAPTSRQGEVSVYHLWLGVP
jgi:hypothetical protein